MVDKLLNFSLNYQMRKVKRDERSQYLIYFACKKSG